VTTYARVNYHGWRVGTVTTAVQARVGFGGWYQVPASAAPALPPLTALARTNPRRPRYEIG
jgi:hypothetical protein